MVTVSTWTVSFQVTVVRHSAPSVVKAAFVCWPKANCHLGIAHPASATLADRRSERRAMVGIRGMSGLLARRGVAAPMGDQRTVTLTWTVAVPGPALLRPETAKANESWPR